MDSKSNVAQLLEQIDAPALIVKQGAIIAVNQTAKSHFISPDASIEDALGPYYQDYCQLKNGSLFLTVRFCETDYPCAIHTMDDQHLFVLEEPMQEDHLQAFTLAAAHLRTPISEMMLALDALPKEDVKTRGKLNRSLFRLQRIVGNMSDAGMLLHNSKNTNTDLCSITEEVLEQASALFEACDIEFTYQLPQERIYALANSELIKRAVYNLLSNAVKFSKNSHPIDFKVEKCGNRLLFSVTNLAEDKIMPHNLFNRYKRIPMIEDPRYGMGLGMAIIKSAACNHGGTVLIEKSNDGMIRITMSITLKKSSAVVVRTPIIIPDIYGGQSQALIELSDVLSASMYENL